MQQAYRVLRVVAEAQTIRMTLTFNPNELMLHELVTACTALNSESSSGIKAVVLDFSTLADTNGTGNETIHSDTLNTAITTVQTLEPPVLAVVRGSLSKAASAIVQVADLSLVAYDAVLHLHNSDQDHNRSVENTYTGKEALRLGYATWSVPASTINTELERILDLLRGKSAIALRLTKASVHIGTTQPLSEHQEPDTTTRLEALKRVNDFYLKQVMQTEDTTEGLHAFLEKRKPQWKNR